MLRKNIISRRVLFAGLILATAAGGATAQQSGSSRHSAIGHANAMSEAFRDATSRVMPAVVEIRSIAEGGVARQQLPPQLRQFEEFFGPDAFRRPRREGSGSGVIINQDGLILTNNHVVEDADEVIVELPDGREFEATDIRTDPDSDIAILRISGAGQLPVARLGDSDASQIGDWVLAIGSPFRLEASVSAGIISAKGRSIGAAQRATFLQTDAAINPGNSGGPLVNLNGEVIGINTAIKSSTGGYQGIGFAIPVNLAKWVIKQLIDDGEVRRAYLGVGVAELDQVAADALGVDARTKGVFVRQLYRNSPAARAGLKTGDVITHFDGRPITSGSDLQRAVERSPLGSRQTLSVIRQGDRREISVTLEALPEDLANSSPSRSGNNGTLEESDLGIRLANIDDELIRRFNLPEDVRGVIVVDVARDGIARRSGLRRGMVITQVGSQSIETTRHFNEAMKDADLDRGVLLTVTVPDVGDRLLILRDR